MTNLKGLIGRLNDTCRKALEDAAGLCLSRTNYEVEVEHILLKLLESSNTDLHRILDRFGVNTSRFSKDVVAAIDKFKRGNSRTPSFSPRVPKLIADAWVIGSIDYSATAVRSGHLLLALLTQERGGGLESITEAKLLSVETLRAEFDKIVTGSVEAEISSRAEGRDASPGERRPAGTQGLDLYTVDLTARAKRGELDPVTGRDFEIRQMVDILMRRRQNNPILTGEAGVGKTAVVEGFAQRVASGDVPPPLRGVAVRTLDLGLLQAGAGIKGEFENRLKGVITEVKGSPTPIILFIDEAHTLIGAGGAAGQNDAANLLKPALARGELRTIAATTWAEYKKYFEKDAALTRRFQVVKVDEPKVDQAIGMMRHLAPRLESHHKVRILDEAVEAAVKLSDRYLSGRQLPDKSVSVLDTACARLAVAQNTTPAKVEDCERRLAGLTLEIEIRQREQVTTGAVDAKLDEALAQKVVVEEELAALKARHEQEKVLVEQINLVRKQLEATVAPPAPAVNAVPPPAGQAAAVAGDVAAPAPADAPAPIDVQALRAELLRLSTELHDVQAGDPLMHPVVDARTVGDVISGWTGIPVGKMKGDEITTIMTLHEKLGQRVLGQQRALEAIGERIRISRARLEDPRKPIGVFMLVGPSGVGKTETALALADTLYGGEQNLITINMSEYQEAHTVSSLKGSPPGYVGYGEGGVLTEAVRRKPYSVVLLDEVEKAHQDVMELFYQVFDKGMLEDGEGRVIDFKNTVILLTSNTGTSTIVAATADETKLPAPQALAEALRPDLLDEFPAAFLGRLVVVPYYPIADAIMRDIIRLQLGRIASRIRASYGASFTYDEAMVEAVKARCTEVESGARNVEHVLMRTLLPEISREVLTRLAEERELTSVHVTAGDSGAFEYVIQ
jgi:type VI secretion system protein VasG